MQSSFRALKKSFNLPCFCRGSGGIFCLNAFKEGRTEEWRVRAVEAFMGLGLMRWNCDSWLDFNLRACTMCTARLRCNMRRAPWTLWCNLILSGMQRGCKGVDVTSYSVEMPSSRKEILLSSSDGRQTEVEAAFALDLTGSKILLWWGMNTMTKSNTAALLTF